MKLPWKRVLKRRGAGILTVLVASTLLLLLAFTVAGTSFHHLNVSNRLHHAQAARNLAEASLGKAVAELMYQHDKYKGAFPQDIFPIPNQWSPNGTGGLIAFSPAKVAEYNSLLKVTRLEQSYNNFGTDASLPANGRTLPGESAYLQAVGVDHGVERAMECLIYIPRFPYAVGSAGKVDIFGASKVAAVKDPADMGDPTKELPGHLLSNDTSTSDAVHLHGNQVVITGDVQASGGANFENNSVKGERRLFANQVKIPNIDITSYNPLGQPGCQTVTPGSQSTNQITGLNHSAGSVDYNGGLQLDGGVLYVNGDINIQGQISGEGAIIATGRVTINAAGQVATNNKVAVLSQGDLELTGTSSDRLTVSGIVYSEGKVTTDFASIFGNAVTTSGQGMSLTDTLFYQDPVNGGAVNVTTPGTAGGVELPNGFTFPPQNAEPLGLYQPGPPPSVTPFDPQLQVKISQPLSRFDDGTGKVVIRKTMDQGSDINQQPLGPGTYKTLWDPVGLRNYEVPAPTGPPVLNMADVSVTIGGVDIVGTDPNFLTAIRSHCIAVATAANGGPLSAVQLTVLNQFIDQRFGGTNLVNSWTATDLMVGLRTTASGANDKYIFGTAPAGTPGTTIFTLDLNKPDHMNEFLSRAEKIRVLYWRDVQQ